MKIKMIYNKKFFSVLISALLIFLWFLVVWKTDNFLYQSLMTILGMTAFILLGYLISGRNYKYAGYSAALGNAVIFGVVMLDSIEKAFMQSAGNRGFILEIDMTTEAIIALFMAFTILPILFIRLFSVGDKNDSEKQRLEFLRTFKTLSIILLVIYSSIFIICMVMERTREIDLGYNLIPLNIIKEYIDNMRGGNPLNPILLLVGNVILLLPMGFYARMFFPKLKKRYLFMIPAAISVAVEISQLIFKNGHSDIDDVILNFVGFLIGYGFKILFDKIRQRVTLKEEMTIFPLFFSKY